MNSTASSSDTFDMGGMFRSSAKITFVVQIVSVIVIVGSLAAYFIGNYVMSLDIEMQILLLLIGIIVTLIIFMAAFGVFIRFSRRVGDAVVGPGLQEVKMNSPRVKAVVYTYVLLIAVMFITGIYVWYLVDKNFLAPWAASLDSISLRIFDLALGAFFIALLIQIIIAAVGRTASKVIIEVLDMDDEEFLE